tara:strand:- start:51 stop:1139 length:1089 start_codon:yes stop_codon:yes gene_type:complete
MLTQGKKVLAFEKAWSRWLGVRYSVFVNSGSSANFLTFLCLNVMGKKGGVILPSLTWISDVVAVIKNDFRPDFTDIDFKTLSMNEAEILNKIEKKNNKILFITHAQGFNGLTQKILNKIKQKKIILVEDVCESHGATFNNKKLGTFGLVSNFSFYYAHHMSTIEGGMICTNNKQIYETCRILRGHGMAREMSDKKLERKIINKYKKLSPKFIFMYPGFNMRSNEINAFIGLEQLKRLDKNVLQRKKNFQIFLDHIDSKKFFTEFQIKGNSNYAFPLILLSKSLKKRDRLEKIMKDNNIEFRRGNAGGGNQLRQPYLKRYIKNIDLSKYKNVEHIHFFGYYIGNFPSLKKNKIIQICKVLNQV